MKDKPTESMEIMNNISKTGIGAEEVKLTWATIGKRYRIKKWRKELDNLAKQSGYTLAGIASCIGVTVSERPGFYNKLPQEKETYVKIALVLGQNKKTVNRWITKNTKKAKLYAKYPIDLIGIYFLDLKSDDFKPHDKIHMYLECVNEFKIHKSELDNLNSEDTAKPMETIELESNLKDKKIKNGDEFIDFVISNKNSFIETNANPRDYIKNYIEVLLQSKNRTKRKHEEKWTAFKLREMNYISDALYNYIMGDIKSAQIPKKKSTYIKYAIELGMSSKQTNEVLELAGFDKLNINDSEEGFAEFSLTPILIGWESTHANAKKWREKYINENSIEIPLNEEREGLKQILSMREDLIITFNKENIYFPY
ncbi:MAG: hypothetical protein Q4C46_02995 [Bacillota bacterium]|nr:hypothetical protein [Bacillota bacterium]